MLGNDKNKYIIYWIAHSDNAILLYLTGILSGLVSENETETEFFSFEREPLFENIKGDTPLERLIFLLSNIPFLREAINKLNCQHEFENNLITETESEIDSEIKLENNDEEIIKLKNQLINNESLCLSWMNKCNYSLSSDEFIDYIFSNDGNDDLDNILESYNESSEIDN
jgi:hypothetical protein